jgi:hypothetical protein
MTRDNRLLTDLVQCRKAHWAMDFCSLPGLRKAIALIPGVKSRALLHPVYLAVILDDTAQDFPGRLDLTDLEAHLADLATEWPASSPERAIERS